MTQRIIVVDDELTILALVTEILRDEGYDVASTPNAAEALEWISADRPDLIVLDMRMPIMDGWTFSREMKGRGIDVPIVVMTAAQDAAAWATEIGAVGSVGKPFDIEPLLHEVAQALAPA